MKLPFIATILVSHCFHWTYVKYNKKHGRAIISLYITAYLQLYIGPSSMENKYVVGIMMD